MSEAKLACFRESDVYSYPSLDACKLHILNGDKTACGRAAYWDTDVRLEAEHVHPIHRCMRNGCKQLWPESKEGRRV